MFISFGASGRPSVETVAFQDNFIFIIDNKRKNLTHKIRTQEFFPNLPTKSVKIIRSPMNLNTCMEKSVKK